jgi:A/G-specific adenine glycosylase
MTASTLPKKSHNFPVVELLNWFIIEKRDFPWRKNPSFYEVLVSELMLQQTVAKTVIPYFVAWMKKFPTLIHLADADYTEVMKAWEGLGYYSRARHLHAIAKALKQASCLPTTYEALREFKGIGDYTASAIMAFAYQKPYIALDGNVLRVASRFFGIEDSIASLKTKKDIQGKLHQIERENGALAEALIELGALICSKTPKCHLCPLAQSCVALNLNKIEQIPKVTPRKKVVKIKNLIAACFCQNEVLVKKQEAHLMRDLYEFPKAQDLDLLASLVECEEKIAPLKRTYTHFSETLEPTIYQLKNKIDFQGFQWIDYKKLQDLPFSSGHRTIRDLILKKIII